MEPSLLPDLAHIPVLVATCVTAALCIGLGVWVGARRVEIALIAGWGVAGFATVLAGTLTNVGLSRVMLVLAAGGFAGLVRTAVAASRGTRLLKSGAAAKVAVLALPLVACVEGIETIGWDDFSHWVPNLSYLCEHDHFPTVALPALSDHAGYPYALALPGFAVFLMLGRVPDNCAIYWNVIAMLAASASVATVLAGRLAERDPDPRQRVIAGWSSAAIGLMACGLASPAFVPKIFFSNMADAATGAVLAVLGSLVFEWIGAPRERRGPIALTFAAACVTLVDLRQANAALFGLLILGCVLAWWRHRDDPGTGTLRSLTIAVIPPLLVLRLWGHYAESQIPGGQIGILAFGEWRWVLFPEALHSMLRVMLAKTGLFLLILLVFVRAALSFKLGDDLGQPARGVVIVSAVVCVGMIFFLAFTYLAAGFERDEAAAAASFWRYMGEVGPIAMLAAVAGVPLAWVRRVRPVPAMTVLLSIAVVLPVATVRFYRADLTSPVPRLRSMAREVRAIVPRTAALLLVDLTGNGFAPLVVTYELMLSGRDFGLAPRPVTQISSVGGIPVQDAAKIDFSGAQFIWLAEGAPEMAQIFGMPLSAGCSYLLKQESRVFSIAAVWRIGPYKWGSYRDGWSAATEARCR